MKRAYRLAALSLVLSLLAGCGGSSIDNSLRTVLDQGVLRVAVPLQGVFAERSAEQAQRLADQLGVTCSLVTGDGREALLSLCDNNEADLVLAGIPYNNQLDTTHTLSSSYQKESIFFVTKPDSYAYTKGMLKDEPLGMDLNISPETSIELSTISENINRKLDDNTLIASAIAQGGLSGYFCYIDRAKALTQDGKLKAISITNLPSEEHVMVMKKGATALKEQLDAILIAQRMPAPSQPEQGGE